MATNTEAASERSALPEWVEAALLIACAVIIVLSFVKLCWYGDTLSVVLYLSQIVLWFGLILLYGAIADTKKSATKLMFDICGRAVQMLTLLSAVGLFVLGPPFEGVWIDVRDRASTLSQPLLFLTPLVSPVERVPKKLTAESVPVKIVTQDGVPLNCVVSVSGVHLQNHDVSALESFLIEAAATPQGARAVLTEGLVAAVSAVSKRVLSQMTTAEITQKRPLPIYHRIGVGIGNALPALFLRWERGSVGFDCSVVFES